MSKELAELLKEVVQLRKETDSLICHCSQPNCPFNPSKSNGSQSSLNSLELSQSSEEDDRLSLRRQWSPVHVNETTQHSSSTGNLTMTVPGVQRRADGTIVEGDGPRYSLGQKRKTRRYGTYNGFNQTNYLDIANCVIRETEDCTVDYDNSFSTKGYEFSRQAPERRQFRSPKRHSQLKTSASYPITSRKTSLPPSPSISHKSTNSVEESSCQEQRGRSASSPVLSSSTRHISIDQITQKPSKKNHLGRSLQQA